MSLEKLLKEARTYRPLDLMLGDEYNFTKLEKLEIYKRITKETLRLSGIEDVRKDYPKLKNYLRDKIIIPFKIEISSKNLKQRSDPHIELGKQREFLRKLSFVDIALPLKEFRIFVSAIRKEFSINPEQLLKEIGLSEEEIGKATYTSKPWQIHAVLKKLGLGSEIKERIKLKKHKDEFEKNFFSKYKRTKSNFSKKNPYQINRRSKKLWIPPSQQPHVRNFILYGIVTGNLFSIHGTSRGETREWERRILKENKDQGYIPFLRSYFYYYYRVFRKEKSIVATNKKLEILGFPPIAHREQDDTMKKRYENLFLK